MAVHLQVIDRDDPLSLSSIEVVSSPTLSIREVVRGRDAVVRLKDQLVELGERCDQRDDMADLEYFLDRPKFRTKRPCLLLMSGSAAGGPEGEESGEIQAAVLVWEYMFLGIGSRVFVADYHGGDRTVIAPEPLRRQAAFEACSELLRRGALVAQLSVSEDLEDPRTPDTDWGAGAAAMRRWRWAAKARRMPGYLRVAESVDDTLALLGKHTRRNLRYYRRRAEAELDYEFVPRAQMSKREFMELNRMCPYPAAEQTASWRYDVLQGLSNGLLMGLRKRSGEWLSLVGGRLHERSMAIEWQVNRADLPDHSLCTVMRLHLIEHAVEQQMKRLYFVGGTTHSMRYSLVEKRTLDLVGVQFDLPSWLVRWLAQPVKLERNFVVQHLADDELHWHRW